MSIYIYNTLTRKKEKFIPIKKGEVGIYVCGPTVYDEPHIGHVRSSLIFEVIRRYFEFNNYKVKYVKNITDIDDKVIQVARRDKSEKKDIMNKVKEVAQKYEKKYHQHMKLLGIKRADIEPCATEHIDDMIEMIQEIIRHNYGYESDGNVYFSVRKYFEYGKLSGQSLEKIGQQRRLHVDEAKQDALDFALWKKSASDEPWWESPWSKGRPGWHIECSAMSTKYLGEHFDIHCGGRDLIFPHHENEIAQAKAAGNNFARYWLHNGLLSINGEKMSKSLGNFVTVEDVLKDYSPDALNILFLSTHYSKPIDFSWEKLDQAEKSADRFRVLFDKLESLLKDVKYENLQVSEKKLNKLAQGLRQHIKISFSKFKQAMDDNFNTALALSKMFDLVNYINKFLDHKDRNLDQNDKFLLVDAKNKLDQMSNILCIFTQPETQKISNKFTEELLNLLLQIREEAREKRLFSFADKIRERLAKLGIILEDTKEGTNYRVKRKKVT